MLVRLQKFMGDCGVAARRKCEQLILEGQVRVNGQVPQKMPVLIDPQKDIITVGDDIVEALKPEKQVYLLLYKPKGILVTHNDPAARKTVHELLRGVTARLFPVGRLDMDSRGLVLMTNDGELANAISHPRYGVEKTYVVTVDARLSVEAVERIRKGIWLGAPHGVRAQRADGFTLRVLSRERDKTILEVKIAEGKNREFRRVLARFGYRVSDMFRVAIAGKITAAGLSPGEFRPLSPKELQWLRTVSAPDYHDQKRQATQKWYERKEMEKERKRLQPHSAVDISRVAPAARATKGSRS
ncbi:MAG: pseudouridine synthase [Phycisphaerae bacterium]